MSGEIDSSFVESSHVTGSGQLNRFRCKECSKSFGRVEHLTRHSQSHSKERTFKCTHCRKGFYRSDALIRHARIHENLNEPSVGRPPRACLACSAGRRKCSRELPCAGCSQRSIECIFPDSAVPRAATPTSSQSGDQENVEHDAAVHDDTGVELNTSPSPWSNVPAVSGESHSNYGLSNLSPVNDSTGFFSGVGRSAEQLSAYDPENPLVPSVGQDSHASVTMPQSQWNAGTTLTTYREDWQEHSYPSINWLPDNWTPAFDLPESMRITSTRTSQIGIGRGLEQGHPLNANVNDSVEVESPIDPRRHWQANTPSGSLGSDHGSGSYSQPSAGRLYVDGDGARLPRIRRAPPDLEKPNDDEAYDLNPHSQNIFWFPEIDGNHWSMDLPVLQEARISLSSYDKMCEVFQSQCVTSSLFSPYYTSNFLPVGILNEYIRLYLLNFLPIFPFIHPASFEAHSAHWLLVLALSAVGSIYHDGSTKEVKQCSLAMMEFLRRAIISYQESEHDSESNSVIMIEVKLLSSIISMYCGNPHEQQKAKSNHLELVQFCLTEWSQVDEAPGISHLEASVDPEDQKRDWKAWYKKETCRRIGYCIWLLDCMWAFHFQTRPLLSLEDATIALPCQEVLWEANSASEWQQLHSVSISSTTLYSAVQRAYLEKQLQSSMGEFSRILCIHALFHRTWDVKSYFQKPLTAWTPKADRQSVASIETSTAPWLSGIPTYSKWRNCACDVLDILHWHANSVIGAASGMEHPTVLHLHLARVVLLTPFNEIIDLTHNLARGSHENSKTELLHKLKLHLQRWAVEDQYKARLAMIHAGVLFWHVRRYSTDAFYEPSSVFLATLALWAYATFAPKRPVPDSEDDNDHLPDSMQLDRPADDELVQLFVKRGHFMKANVTGVGDLRSDKGPAKVLRQGRRLLGGLKKWGIGIVLGQVLRDLSNSDLDIDLQEIS